MKRTFICYAHDDEDRELARRLYRDLLGAGHAPWLDEIDLLPGEDWAARITKEIRQCKHFIALLSSRSLDRRGFVQRELRVALEVLDTIPVDERFLIPLRINHCEPKDERLTRLHWADLFPDYDVGLRKVLRALESGRQVPGGLWIDVGVEIPPDISSWPDDRLCGYIRAVLRPEARERASRDYENVPMRDPDRAIRIRTEEKLLEVASRFGFVDALRRCLDKDRPNGAAEHRPGFS
jgi:TIR domain